MPSEQTGWSRGERVWLTVTLFATVFMLVMAYRWWMTYQINRPPEQVAQNATTTRPKPTVAAKQTASPPEKSEPGGFLEEFSEGTQKNDKETGVKVPSNDELEMNFKSLADLDSQLEALKKRLVQRDAGTTESEISELEASSKRLLRQFDEQAPVLGKQLRQAAKARPEDAVVRWLTGELLMLVGGEPEEVAPHLKFALDHGLKRPRLLGSMALVELKMNQFADAYRRAGQALDLLEQDRHLWMIYTKTAFSLQRFEDVLERQQRAFSSGLPAWGKKIFEDALALQLKWHAEEKLRRAEAKANDLPRVKLLIEHRRFAKDAAGQPLTTIENTGRGEVVLELFENEAPETVANFIDLVSRKFYDGTSFHLSLPATLVQGGDPNTKNNDPADDGTGGPGYAIADEFKSPKARHHFRGSLSMVNTGPGTTGSQFFVTLTPQPEMDGHFTVFGRVVQGQDVLDQLTPGRTTRELGHYGRIIPGDLLIRAEVLRKRPHEYKAHKQ